MQSIHNFPADNLYLYHLDMSSLQQLYSQYIFSTTQYKDIIHEMYSYKFHIQSVQNSIQTLCSQYIVCQIQICIQYTVLIWLDCYFYMVSIEQYSDTMQTVYSLFVANMHSIYSLNIVSIQFLYSQYTIDIQSVQSSIQILCSQYIISLFPICIQHTVLIWLECYCYMVSILFIYNQYRVVFRHY